MYHETYTCPECEEEFSVLETQETLACPHCKVNLRVNRDADFRDGSWHNMTTITKQ